MTEHPDLLPAWAYDLIIAADRHEATHNGPHEGAFCVHKQLRAVPAHHLAGARAVANYLDGKLLDELGLENLVEGIGRIGHMPCWFYDLLDAMDLRRAHACCDFHDVLRSIPAEEMNASRAIGNYLRERMAAAS